MLPQLAVCTEVILAALGLDLSGAHAKVARARTHVQTLYGESERVLQNRSPYSIEVGDFDHDTGWISAYLLIRPLPEPHLSAVVGDAFHNLRCALDYIVSELTFHSCPPLDPFRLTFPVYVDGPAFARYRAKCLGDLPQEALDLMDRLQPYHLQPKPRASPLWHVYRFSNADKHRQLAAFLVPITAHGLELSHDGRLVERWEAPDAFNDIWSGRNKSEIARFRFAEPYPTYVHYGGPLDAVPCWRVDPLPTETEGLVLGTTAIDECCESIGTAVELFEQL
jgi:hypothetical protein